MRAFIASLLAASAFATDKNTSGGFDYREGGNNWTELYKDTIDGFMCDTSRKQSPIDLKETDGVVKDKDMSIEIKGLGKGTMKDFDALTNFSVDWKFPFDAAWSW